MVRIVSAPPEHYFWVVNGMVLKDLYELSIALKSMDEGTFAHHVHDGNNDFANWVKDVFQDKKLAELMRHALHAKGMAHLIERRLKEQEKMISMPNKKNILSSIKEAFVHA